MNWVLEHRACPICATHDASVEWARARVDLAQLSEFSFASRKRPEYMHWRLEECRTCDLVCSNPAPSVEDLAKLYRDAAFDSGDEARLAARTYGSELSRLAPRLPDREGALDIGTGDGAFLHELLDLGFAGVKGIEPSSAPIAAADPRVRPWIQQGLFRPGIFQAETFRVVTCFQTIEHVPNPLELCKEAYRLLKPGGLLLLVGHNRRAWSAKVLRRKSPIFDLEHLQLFSPKSFEKLLTKAGFASAHVSPLWNRYPLSYWLRLFPLPSGPKTTAMRLANELPVGRIPLSIPAGNLVAAAWK
jgi:SAM-dependent methyltransferase